MTGKHKYQKKKEVSKKVQNWAGLQIIKGLFGIPIMPVKQLFMNNKEGKNNNLGNHSIWRARGFYFEDYKIQKYEYKDQSKLSEVKLSLSRVSFIFFIFLVVAFVFGSKIIYLASIKKEKFFTIKSVPSSFLKTISLLSKISFFV